MTDIVERLRTQIANASLGDRKYERPMTWDEADFVLSEIERLRAALKEAAAKRTDCEKSSNELFLRREEAQSELNAAADEIERLRAALMQCKIIAEQYQKENEESSRWQGSGKAQIKARAVAVRCGFLVGSLRKVINAALSGAR